jgi:hypothetical protein
MCEAESDCMILVTPRVRMFCLKTFLGDEPRIFLGVSALAANGFDTPAHEHGKTKQHGGRQDQ